MKLNVKTKSALFVAAGSLAVCFTVSNASATQRLFGYSYEPETMVKGTFEFETYSNEAPKTVAHVVELVKGGFYDGQRVHRALPGFVVQWGDPRSRDLSIETEWGRGTGASSGKPVGVAEISKKHANTRGAVALAHPGSPALADSQIYVTLADRPDLNGRYTVFGRVTSGEEVLPRLERGDLIRKMSVKQ